MINFAKSPCDEGVIRAAPVSSPCVKKLAPWIMAATILGSGMAFIDGTVVNVALPALQAELGATVTELQWIVEAYALFIAALILVGGSLSDHFGRRRIFAIGIVLFALASVWCGLAPNIVQLILARGLQSVGAALLVPASLAIISASFDEEQRARAIGTWSGFTAMTAALGPVLGGWMIENMSWRWIFVINVPLALIVLAILFSRVPESRDTQLAGKLDWWGAALVTTGLGCIVYGLIESVNLGLGHPLAISILFVGFTALLVFLVVERRSPQPILPMTLFRFRVFSGANLLTFLLYAGLVGTLFFVPFNLVQVQGYSTTAAGAAFLPLILIMSLFSRWAGGLMRRYGARFPLTVGPSIAAGGFALFAVPYVGGSYWTTFFPAFVVLGVGMAISVAPLTSTVMGAVQVRHSGTASGINNAASRTAGLLAIPIFGIIILNTFTADLDSRLAALGLPTEIQRNIREQRMKLAGIEVPHEIDRTLRSDIGQAIDYSFVSSFRVAMLISAGLTVASALTGWFIIGGGSFSPESLAAEKELGVQDVEHQLVKLARNRDLDSAIQSASKLPMTSSLVLVRCTRRSGNMCAEYSIPRLQMIKTGLQSKCPWFGIERQGSI